LAQVEPAVQDAKQGKLISSKITRLLEKWKHENPHCANKLVKMNVSEPKYVSLSPPP
jgi:hypothetical protein